MKRDGMENPYQSRQTKVHRFPFLKKYHPYLGLMTQTAYVWVKGFAPPPNQGVVLYGPI